MKNRTITFTAIFFTLGCLALPAGVQAGEQRDLGGCSAFVEDDTLFVIGNEIANVIGIEGTEGVQVTCDGVSATFDRTEAVTVEAGDGDDQISADDSNGLLAGIVIRAFGQEGDDEIRWLAQLAVNIVDFVDADGGPGDDILLIVTGPGADRCDVRRGEAPDAVEVQVTDLTTGAPLGHISGSALEVLTVEMGDGNDRANVSQLVGTALNILGQGGDDITLIEVLVEIFPQGTSSITVVDLGLGEDELIIESTPLEDRFDITPGLDSNSVAVQVTDIATGRVTGNVAASAIELTSVKMGAGNDILNSIVGLPTVLSVFEEEGDGQVTLILPLELLDLLEVLGPTFILGGPGHDKFTYKGTTFSEQYEIAGVPAPEIPDPELRVTDIATGLELAHVQFLHVEDVALDASGGDDVVDVQWDAALMSTLFRVGVDLGQGNNTMSVNLLPVLTMPETEGVQTARFDMAGASGADNVIFNHSAGGWFDVFFTLDTGKGDDDFSVVLAPPPDDSLPPPEGLRSLQFDVAAGRGNDFVSIHNRTTDELSVTNLSADFGVGDDTFEAVGAILPCVYPGPGFDTARVTRNLLPFVAEFERVEILD